MIFLLSPAKSLDYDTPLPAGLSRKATEPAYTDRAAELIEVLRPLSPAKVASLMDLSDNLASLNAARYSAWSPKATAANSRPAVLAFNGDVYDGLQAATLSGEDLAWAQDHLVILSGLYGALRPLDKLQPYRLEMGTKLANPLGKDLYAFWGDEVARHLNGRIPSRRSAASGDPVIVNLASQEYFKVADRKALKARVVECVFEDWKGGSYKVISFFAKRARGLMARHAILNRAAKVDDLKSFKLDGYAWNAQASELDRLVFRRRQA
jgi:cytoplasmic iron level regulating protein YaaA (DUF328/UPF0246 family)